MGPVETFLENLNMDYLFYYLSQAVIALFCIVIHEMSHGYAAYFLGDTTAKAEGRLSPNPLRHIDLLGLLLMITAGFGWAKPVPVDMRRFKKPKSGMAITALAGPVSNLVLAWLALLLASGLYHIPAYPTELMLRIASGAFGVCLRLAALSVGLGVFNLIPIPPLDGSKVLFSLLPNRIYITILRYERYVMLAVFALVFLGCLDVPLSIARNAVLGVLCKLSGLPANFFV